MVDVELIKQMKKHHSIREIARMTGWSRQTVRKHLEAPAEPPTYRAAGPRRCPVMDPYLDVVKRWLEDDEDAPRKQRHTAKRVNDRLVDEYGFGGAEITVRQAVAKLRGKRTEAYIPLEAPWGGIAQADFGGAVVTIAGQRTEVSLFCMRAKASKVPFVIAVLSEQHDEWQVSRRYMSAESIAVAMRPPLTALETETETEEDVPALMAG